MCAKPICLAAILLFVSLSPAAAAVLRVPADYATIQEAVDASAPGDTVELADGTFRGDGNRDVDLGGNSITVRSATGYPDHCTIFCEGGFETPHRGFLVPDGPAPGPVLEGITIAYAYGVVGGGIYSEGACTVVRCAFVNCSAMGLGGGAYLGGPALVTDCSFTQTAADNGGAVAVSNCRAGTGVGLLRCTFDSNTSFGAGGAILCRYATGTLDGCTVYGSVSQTAAIHAGPSATMSIRNTIVAFASQGSAVSVETTSLVDLACSDLFGNAGGDWTGSIAGQLGANGNVSLDPLFCDTAHDDFGLQEPSPCVPGHNPVCGQIGAWGRGCGPDLAVLRIDPDWAPAGEPVPVRVLVANLGTRNAGSSETSLLVDGLAACGSLVTPSLGPCTQRVLTCERAAAPAGVLHLEACADALQQISESNETNNCRFEDLYLLAPGGADEPAQDLPCGIVSVRPNPATAVATITFRLLRETPARLYLIDVSGRRVRTLDGGVLARGSHATRWDGTDDRGEPVPSGVYFAVLWTPERMFRESIVLSR